MIRVVDRLNITAEGPEAPDQMPPTPINWTLVVVLKSGEAKGAHQLRIEPLLPAGDIEHAQDVDFTLEGGNRGAQIVARFRMSLTVPGVYWVKLYVDGQFMTQLPIEVEYSRCPN